MSSQVLRVQTTRLLGGADTLGRCVLSGGSDQTPPGAAGLAAVCVLMCAHVCTGSGEECAQGFIAAGVCTWVCRLCANVSVSGVCR